jgi:hypothetical protein
MARKQPDLLEFAVTAIGFDGQDISDKRYRHIRVKLGLILITTCSGSTPKVYTRVAAIEGKISQEEWVRMARLASSCLMLAVPKRQDDKCFSNAQLP